jgi:acyl-CoA synthetase (AMP-forming)/AMP-acid ligase II
MGNRRSWEMSQMFEQLVRFDPDRKMVNGFAESWELQEQDGKAVIDARLRSIRRLPAAAWRLDMKRGPVPVAFVLLKPQACAGVTPEAIEDWCRERTAIFKLPEVRIVDALPITATGKVKKQELRQLLDA